MRNAAETTTEPKPARRAGRRKMTAPALAAVCADYFEKCDGEGRRPTWQGLAGAADVTSSTLTRWLRAGEGDTLSEILQKAADAISDRLQQRTDSMAVLSVKQPLFGAFLDRTQAGGEGTLTVEVTVGGAEKETADFGK